MNARKSSLNDSAGGVAIQSSYAGPGNASPGGCLSLTTTSLRLRLRKLQILFSPYRQFKGYLRAIALKVSYQRKLKSLDRALRSPAFANTLSASLGAESCAQMDDLCASLIYVRQILIPEVMENLVSPSPLGGNADALRALPMSCEKEYFAASKGIFEFETFCLFVQCVTSVSPMNARQIDMLLPGILITWMLALADRLDGLRFSEIEEPTGISDLITSISKISKCSVPCFVQLVCAIDRECRTDTVDVYAQMSFATQQAYRYRIDEIASAYHQPPLQVTKVALALASRSYDSGSRNRHIGFYLFGNEKALLNEQLSAQEPMTTPASPACYRAPRVRGSASCLPPRPIKVERIVKLISVELMFSVLLSEPLCVIFGVRSSITMLMCWLSALAISINVVSRMRLVGLKRRCTFSMAFDAGLPKNCATVVAVPVLIGNEAQVDLLIQHVNELHRKIGDQNVDIAILADFPDSTAPELTERERTVLDYLVTAVSKLCHTNSAGSAGLTQFLGLFYRHRVYSDKQRCYMGHERKRGKLDSFNKLIATAQNDFDIVLADHKRIARWSYVVYLDEDAIVTECCVHRMIAALTHPLNTPQKEVDTRVYAGYGIAVPAIILRRDSALGWLFGPSLLGAVTPHPSTTRRLFTIFGRTVELQTGAEGFTTDSGKTAKLARDYMYDELEECAFPGKGAVNPFNATATLSLALPSDSILSHDTVEGALLRPIFVPDAVIAEGFPQSYADFCVRRHRWIRGDWQNAAMLIADRIRMPTAPRKSMLRFTLFVQICHSLSIVGMGLGLTFASMTGRTEIRGLLAALMTLLLLFDLAKCIGLTISYYASGFSARVIAEPSVIFGKTLISVVVRIALSLHQSMLAIDAIITAIYRVFLGRGLLEWRELSDGSVWRISNRIRASHYVSALICGGILALQLNSASELSISQSVLAILGFAPMIASTTLFTRPNGTRNKP